MDAECEAKLNAVRDLVDAVRTSTRDQLDAAVVLAKERVASAFSLTDERFAAADRALKLQAESYRFHLEQLEKEVGELTRYKNTMEGKASQTSVMVAIFFSFVAALIGILGLVLK